MKYNIQKNVIHNTENIIKVDHNVVDELKQLAQNSPNRRARLCLHRNSGDSLQEMVIALCRDSYIRPHKHIDKNETFHIIEGSLKLFIFNDSGRIVDSFYMEAFGKKNIFLYRSVPNLWHMPVP